jgi:predicted transcriptional regulator
MKNVTITMDDAVADWVRIEAAKRNTSVSRLVGEMLLEKMQREDAYARAEREWQADDVTFTSTKQPYLGRAEIYA